MYHQKSKKPYICYINLPPIISYEYSEDHLIEDAAAEVLEALEWQMEKLFNGFHPREDTEEIGRHLWFSAGYRPEGRPAIKMVT